MSAAGDARVLAAIHAWTAERAPVLERVVPPGAPEGAPLLLLGLRLAGARAARFGAVSTWVVALSDTAAVTVVPPGTAGAVVSVERGGLRSNGVPLDGGAEPRVVRCDPGHGARDVWRDPVIVLRCSHPLDRASLGDGVELHDAAGEVPLDVLASPDRRALVARPRRLLAPEAAHELRVRGLRDVSGREVAPFACLFLTGLRRWLDGAP